MAPQREPEDRGGARGRRSPLGGLPRRVDAGGSPELEGPQCGGRGVKAELLSFTPLGELRKVAPDGLPDEGLLPHLTYVFAIEGISRACSHQLVRHRTASYSQQSQRYIPVRRLRERVVIPPSVSEKALNEYMSLMDRASDAYGGLVDTGVPREDARFVLPNAAETSLLFTIDGRSLLHFFGIRCCNRAQWEIRALADRMLAEVRGEEPAIFGRAGPNCYWLGYCPEGRFTCGRMDEVVESYRDPGLGVVE
ncbi:FAD-dependent thymidylate synthase [Candidatus Bathyarchaeota archaeon]|nr:FAD-dependent thymidylate synthase [Candidatus Bathyarchaeota archaeon]